MEIEYRAWLDGGGRRELARNMTAVEVRACPLCGVDGEQILGAWVNVAADRLDEESARGEWAVHCGNCGTTGPGRHAPGQAVESWNERFTDGPD